MTTPLSPQLVFPTHDGKEAGIWAPDGRGHGTHFAPGAPAPERATEGFVVRTPWPPLRTVVKDLQGLSAGVAALDDVLAPLEKATEVRHEGFTVQPRALAVRQVARCHEACKAAYDRAWPGHSAQCAPGHFEVLVPEFAGPDFGFLHAGAPWMSPARALLGDDCVLLAGGVLDADPGAAAGEAHRQGSHLLEEPLPGAAAAAPHCITIFIPLTDIDGETNGIAMWPRSHHGHGWSPPAAAGLPPSPPAGEASDAAASTRHPQVSDASCDENDAMAVVSPALRAGDAVLCDFRLLHKALGNKTEARRPVVYLILARPWFRDGRHRPYPVAEVVSPFDRVKLGAEYAPVPVGARVWLFLGGAWARALAAKVEPQTEVYVGTPWRRSVRMGRVVMDATGEEKEGDIDELFMKGHFIVEATGNVTEEQEEEEEEEEEERVGKGAEGLVSAEQKQQEAAPSNESSGSESSDDDDDTSSVASIDEEPVAPMWVSRLRSACAAEFLAEGFTIASGALTPAEVAQTRAVCEEARAAAGEAHRLELGPGKLDLLIPAFATEQFKFLHAGAPWMGAVREVLGDDCSLFTGGVLFNEPGAGGGNVHLDGDPLFETPAPGATAPPPHALSVFIPLIDVDGATNGTALWPRSHHGAGWAPPEDSAPPAGNAVTHRGKAVAATLSAGDALFFDFRLLHRALANGTGDVRPVVYLIIARRWFRDCDNWPDVEVSRAFDLVRLSAESGQNDDDVQAAVAIVDTQPKHSQTLA
ncbi:hypothetical protein CYMTET_10715 [Cymbomonas tetramitiformis]|uniref:Uncharacterized protein n=1 Tax=Cymbomonas tetramitiformis TaxID=36881 RepID=A0AAE0LDW6_9CHLO|nr:hypothetical protein CYMTET_10715 [Cymbomonas tetramitiformis]